MSGTLSALAAEGSGPTATLPGCLPGHRGYLQASLRGALQAQLDWRGPALDCQGGARADAQGMRLSLSGPLMTADRRLRIIIGMAATPGRSSRGPLPANVTVIVEDGNRIYATRGEHGCEVEALQQQPLPVTAATNAAGAHARQFRVAVRGFCIDPLPLLSANADTADKLYIDRFDIAALASFSPESIDASTAAN